MLSNCSHIFMRQSTSPHFLVTLQDLLESSRTSPSVRERVMAALADAVSTDLGFRLLWRRVRSPALSPTSSGGDASASDDDYSEGAAAVTPASGTASPPPLPDEDMGWLIDECATGTKNATLLRQALETAPPEILVNTENIIGGLHKKCMDSHKIILTWIPHVGDPERSGREEEALRALLGANETLLETIKLYDDIKRAVKWIVWAEFSCTRPDELPVTAGGARPIAVHRPVGAL
ncbi:hypothetical protein DFH07DRAFT_387511 [Mycena maculata]|uniref:Uncharacterized protein n=1 Tax=Mycena maculata TaxID=230809 RepID=A0AAD7KCL2_9AGAR|nr:hypothetical protein DFH07DRAFT_387511 [Mycena maculata]